MRDKQEQLGWEARVGRLAGFAAWVAAAILLGTMIYRIGVLPSGAKNVQQFLPEVAAHKTAFLVSGVLTAIGMLAFIPPMLYLYEVTRYRRPELPAVTRFLIFLGPILFAVCAVWFQFRQGHAADQFVAGSVKTKKHAEDLLRNSTTAVAGLSLGASIAIGLATIMLSMNAMRAGLLSRFMGVLGIILGALFVLPLIASPVIQLFWLIALGALFIGLWPSGGRGPAWDSGEAIPWPTAQERLAATAQQTDAAEPEGGESEAVAAPQPNPRASRKRKKRSARR